MGHLIIPLLIFAALWIVPIVGYKLYARRKLRREYRYMPQAWSGSLTIDVGPQPSEHRCAPGTFLPVAATSGMPPEAGEGKRIFEGVSCSACKARLYCDACRRTPHLGAELSSERAEPRKLLECCAKPDWWIFPPSAPDDDDAPAFAKYGDRPDAN